MSLRLYAYGKRIWLCLESLSEVYGYCGVWKEVKSLSEGGGHFVFRYNDLRDCTSSVVWRILRQAAAMMVQRRSEFGAGTDALVSAHASTPSG